LDFEISFLNRQGKLCCSFTAMFVSGQAAARYAESVMLTRRCRHFVSAEISTLDTPYPILVSRSAEAERSGPAHRRNQKSTSLWQNL
jgi:hypothetical protein